MDGYLFFFSIHLLTPMADLRTIVLSYDLFSLTHCRVFTAGRPSCTSHASRCWWRGPTGQENNRPTPSLAMGTWIMDRRHCNVLCRAFQRLLDNSRMCQGRMFIPCFPHTSLTPPYTSLTPPGHQERDPGDGHKALPQLRDLPPGGDIARPGRRSAGRIRLPGNYLSSNFQGTEEVFDDLSRTCGSPL